MYYYIVIISHHNIYVIVISLMKVVCFRSRSNFQQSKTTSDQFVRPSRATICQEQSSVTINDNYIQHVSCMLSFEAPSKSHVSDVDWGVTISNQSTCGCGMPGHAKQQPQSWASQLVMHLEVVEFSRGVIVFLHVRNYFLPSLLD